MSAEQMTKQTVDRILFKTLDPTVTLDGRPLPAMTTLLYRVCGNEEKKFEEATRLVALFLAEAIGDGART